VSFRIILVSQNEAGFLPEAVDYFMRRLPSDSSVVSAVVLDPSPFGKRLSGLGKARTALSIFGFKFVILYGLRAIRNLLFKKSVVGVFRDHQVPVLFLCDSINSESSMALLEQEKPDLIISIAANQIFKSRLINLPRCGILNVHSSLLPKYRGLLPSFWVLRNGETESGVSVFFVDDGIDSGPILVQERIQIKGLRQSELIAKTKLLGMEALIVAVVKVMKSQLETMPNADSESSYYHFPTRADVRAFYRMGGRF
jgi:methionyl-tRNA formyltransferase